MDSFRLSAKKVGERINNVGDIWSDNSFVSLQKSMSELAKSSKLVIENGDRACASVDKFFTIASEKI
jgi:hypothetical protein